MFALFFAGSPPIIMSKCPFTCSVVHRELNKRSESFCVFYLVQIVQLSPGGLSYKNYALCIVAFGLCSVCSVFFTFMNVNVM